MNACTRPTFCLFPLGNVSDRPVEDEGEALAEAIPQFDVDAA